VLFSFSAEEVVERWRVFVLSQQVEKDIQGVVAALWLELLEQIAAYVLDQREHHSENYCWGACCD
jgi:hypothetical protein